MENIDNVQFEQKIIKITEGDNAQQMRIKLKVYVKIKTHTPKLSLTDYLGTIEFPLEEGSSFRIYIGRLNRCLTIGKDQ